MAELGWGIVCKIAQGKAEARRKKEVNNMEHLLVDTKPATEEAKMESPGYKEDKGKLRYDLLPPHALDELAKVYTYGANKYTDNNWRKGMKWGRVFGALMRHLWKFWAGEEKDKESGILHLSHALWGVVTLLEYCNDSLYSDFDDRIMGIGRDIAKDIAEDIFVDLKGGIL